MPCPWVRLQRDASRITRTRNASILQQQQRKNIYDVEDDIEEKRDAMIAALEQQRHQKSTNQKLFTIRWQLR